MRWGAPGSERPAGASSPGRAGFEARSPAPGAERAARQLQAETLAGGMPDRVAFPVDSGSLLSLDKYFDSSPHHQSPPGSPSPPPPAPSDRAATFPLGQSLDSISEDCPLHREVKSAQARPERQFICHPSVFQTGSLNQGRVSTHSVTRLGSTLEQGSGLTC